MIWFKQDIYCFSDFPCGFDLFSLTDPGEIVPGNSFSDESFMGNARAVGRCCITELMDGQPAVDCSLQFIWRERSLPQAVSQMVAGRGAWGKVPEGAAVLLPADKPHLLAVSPELVVLWKVSFIRNTDFHLDSLLLQEYAQEYG